MAQKTLEELQAAWETDDAVSTKMAVIPAKASAAPSSTSLGDNTLLLEAIDGEGGFIEEYVKDRSALSDTPPVFHAYTALALVGTAAGNRYGWPARGKTNYPNQFYVCVGPSGVRKSTGLNQGKALLEEAVPNSVLPSAFSRESFDDALERRPDGILVFSEYSEFLRKAKTRDYLGGMVDALTDLYENPGTYRGSFRGRGSYAIDKPAPSILAATTPDRLEEVIDINLVRGGFWPRHLITIAMTPGSPVPFGTTSWPTTSLAQTLKDIAANKGEVDFSAVTVLIDQSEQQYLADLNQRGRNPDLAGMYSRFETQVTRIATLFMLSRTHGATLVITDKDVLRAYKVVTCSHRQMEALPLLFTSTGKILKRVMEKIDAKPGITQHELLRALGTTVKNLRPLIETILVMEYTTTTKDVQGGTRVQYWPPS